MVKVPLLDFATPEDAYIDIPPEAGVCAETQTENYTKVRIYKEKAVQTDHRDPDEAMETRESPVTEHIVENDDVLINLRITSKK